MQQQPRDEEHRDELHENEQNRGDDQHVTKLPPPTHGGATI